MKVDKDNQKDFMDTQSIFLVWDLTKNEIVIETEALSKVKWASWTLANSVNARFQGNQLAAENEEEEAKQRVVEDCIMTSMATFPEILSVVCGNINGDLFIFRFPALCIDRSKVVDFSTERLKKIDMALT
jgi:hypothetical protein